MKPLVNIFWFRRDLRLHDNAGLYQALTSGTPVVPVFIFDKAILDKLEDKNDRRVTFIHAALCEMQEAIKKMGSTLHVFYGLPQEVFQALNVDYKVDKVFINHDYEPYAKERDTAIESLLLHQGSSFHTFKDQVIFEKGEVVKDNKEPYTIFTPYSRKWKERLNDFPVKSFATEQHFNNFFRQEAKPIPSLQSMGFEATAQAFPSKELDEEIAKKYSVNRDFPGINGTSKLGVHLRFGTVSIRQITKQAMALNETYLNELIWRDFYQMILWNFPRVGQHKAFKPAFEQVEWRNNEQEFDQWCNGTTGYPIVDAGMRELNATGFMHNRVRMIVSSFLTKHLLIDWRWGEAYFARKLLDFDLASNNGGWQWAAGSGCDAVPYFRIFNPYLQTAKFDKGLAYINKWVPELNELSYPQPMVQHEFARKRALEVFGKAMGAKKE